MFFTGRIKQVNKVVVSDPSYGEDVWCRYESTIVNKGPWRVQMAVNEASDVFDGVNRYEIKGVEFSLLLCSYAINRTNCKLHEDGGGFTHPKSLDIKKHEIGMDTACVALGINEVADEIKASRGEWKPGCALNTLTDGLFGEVYEGSYNGEVYMVFITGHLDEDTGYSVQDVVGYLKAAFQIKNLELVKDSPSLTEKITAAETKQHPNSNSETPSRQEDLEH